MAKKLFIVWLSVTMVIFSSISIYATENIQGDFFIPKAKLAEVDNASAENNFSAGEKESRTITAVALAAVEETQRQEKEKQEQEKVQYRAGLAAYIISVNRNVNESDASDMADSFIKYAGEYGVDEKCVMAMAQSESTFYSDVVSSEGYKGLMQTGDVLAEREGYSPQDLFHTDVSIKIGAKYFSEKLNEFGDTLLALTAYNQGSGSVNSGNYSTAYGEKIMSRAANIENFLRANGYTE